MSNLLQRFSQVNSNLENLIQQLNSACSHFGEIQETIKTSKENLELSHEKMKELKQGKYFQKESWTAVSSNVEENIIKVEKNCVENREILNKEFEWKEEQKGKIDEFIQARKDVMTENYKKQLKSIK